MKSLNGEWIHQTDGEITDHIEITGFYNFPNYNSILNYVFSYH